MDLISRPALAIDYVQRGWVPHEDKVGTKTYYYLTKGDRQIRITARCYREIMKQEKSDE